MAATSGLSASVQQIGTDDAPIALANAATWRWIHNQGRRAAKIEVLSAVNRGLVLLAVSQPSVNRIDVENDSGDPVDVIVRVTWNQPSANEMAPLAGSVGTIIAP
jgi:hypothetical protein